MRTKLKKSLSMLLALVMLVGLLPTVALAADELGTLTHRVTLGGTEVTSENKSDIFEDGTASYNSDTRTLTLTGYEGGYIESFGSPGSCLTIYLTPGTTNKITVSAGAREHGIYSNSGCRIEGAGNLIVDASTAFSGGSGIWSGDSMVIATSGNVAVYANGPAINAFDSTVTLSGSGNLTAVANTSDAVKGKNAGGAVLLLNGTNPSITLRTKAEGKAAVSNNESAGTLVDGNSISNYTKASGEPNAQAVTYSLTSAVSFSCNVWLGEVEVTAANCTDILGNGTASYDPATKTLTLNGYDGTYIRTEGVNNDLTIDLAEGTENKITVPSGVSGEGIYIEDASCTITGKGNLTVVNNYYARYGIFASSTIEIATEGNVSVQASSSAILSYGGSVVISGSGNLTAVSLLDSTSGVIECDPPSESGIPAFSLNGTGTISLTRYNQRQSVVYNYGSGETYGGTEYDSYKVKEVKGTDNQKTVTYTHYPHSDYDVWVNGTADSIVPVTEANQGDILGNGTISYDPTSKTLTLTGYTGGYIEAANKLDTLKVVLAEGTNNTITVPSEVPYDDVNGIDTRGSCILEGSGNLTINVNNADGAGICAYHHEYREDYNYPCVTVNMSGNLTINSACFGIYARKDILIGGSGEVTITSKRTGLLNEIMSSGNIVLNGSGNLNITSTEWYGIIASSGEIEISGAGAVSVKGTKAAIWDCLILSGNGDVTIESTDGPAIYGNRATVVELNGANPTIKFIAPEGKQAVVNESGTGTPVGGYNFSHYTAAGAPDQNSVTYTKKQMSTPLPSWPTATAASSTTSCVCCWFPMEKPSIKIAQTRFGPRPTPIILSIMASSMWYRIITQMLPARMKTEPTLVLRLPEIRRCTPIGARSTRPLKRQMPRSPSPADITK